jgi:hypothetical protein
MSLWYIRIMPKDDVLNFRVPRDLKLALKKAAEQDERSMSTMAARILREWLMSALIENRVNLDQPARGQEVAGAAKRA